MLQLAEFLAVVIISSWVCPGMDRHSTASRYDYWQESAECVSVQATIEPGWRFGTGAEKAYLRGTTYEDV